MTKYGLYWLGWLACLAWPTGGRAQEAPPPFWHLSVQEGLSNATVTTILQDRYGFMWFGTEDGLNRYDGQAFKVYRADQANAQSLPGNFIKALAEGPDGNLWVATTNGLARYQPHLDKMERVPTFAGTFLTALLVDPQGDLWVAGEGRLAKYLARTNRWEEWQGLFADEHVFGSLAQTSPGVLWASSFGKGLFRIDLKTKKTIHYQKQPGQPNSLADNTIHSLFADGDSALWANTYYSGTSRLDLARGTFTNYRHQPGDPHTPLTDGIVATCRQGSKLLFAVENGGVAEWNPASGKFTNWLHDPQDPQSLVANSVRTLYRDQQGRIWVGSFGRGLSIWDSYRHKFGQLPVLPSDPAINALWRDSRGHLWVGMEEGLAIIANGKSDYVPHQPGNRLGLGPHPILRVREDGQGNIWLGTWLGGVFKLPGGQGRASQYLNQKNANSTGTANLNCVFALGTDGAQLLVGSYGGVHALSPTGKFAPYPRDSLGVAYVQDLFQDSRGDHWLVTLEGLHHVSAVGQRLLATYRHDPQDSASLSSNVCQCLAEDQQQRLWVGTRDGLNLMTSPGRFRRFTTADGLPNNQVCSLVPDLRGNLWVATSQGLALLDPEKLTFKKFLEGSGPDSKQFKLNSALRAPNGEILLGTTSGIVRFHPDSVRDNPHLPPVRLVDFKLFNRSVAVGAPGSPLDLHIGHAPSVVLDHEQSVFTIDFVALNFTQSEKNQYAYRLDPLEKDWNYVGQQRNATYTSLPAGTYTFRVKASNNDGVWNHEGATLQIIVLPPWWATWWFRALAGLVLAGTAWAAYRWRVGFLELQNQRLALEVDNRTKDLAQANEELIQQKEELEQTNEFVQRQSDQLATLNQQKDRLFSIISHDLRSPMAALKNSIDLMNNDLLGPKEQQVIRRELERQFRATNNLLQSLLEWAEGQMKAEVTAPVPVNLALAVAERLDFFENFASQKQVELANQVPADLWALVDPNHLKIMLQNLLANAIKFSFAAGRVVVTGHCRGDKVELAVQDFGKGMTTAQLDKLFTEKHFTTRGTAGEVGTGMGLRLTKELAKKNGGSLGAASTEGQGSRFFLTFASTNAPDGKTA
jgi:ligand-binding sensor domain-containing protein